MLGQYNCVQIIEEVFQHKTIKKNFQKIEIIAEVSSVSTLFSQRAVNINTHCKTTTPALQTFFLYMCYTLHICVVYTKKSTYYYVKF